MWKKLTPFALVTLVAALLIPSTASAVDDGVALVPLGAYESGVDGGSEIVAFSHRVDRAYVTNGDANAIDIIDFSDPGDPQLVGSVDLGPYGDGIQSVAVGRKLVAAAVKAEDDTAPGNLVVTDLDGNVKGVYEVGV